MPRSGERLRLTIRSWNEEGQGVAEAGGLPVFVDNVVPGEVVDARLLVVKRQYAAGVPLEILRPAPERVTPPCPVYARCGGCTLQHVDYSAQLRIKEEFVRRELGRAVAAAAETVRPVLGMVEPWRYRFKGKYPVALVRGKPLLGFYETRSHRLVDAAPCLVQEPAGAALRASCQRFLGKGKISIYDETSGDGLVRHLVTRTTAAGGEVLALVVVNGRDLPGHKHLVEQLRRDVPGFVGLHLNSNTRNTNVITGERTRRLWGSEAVVENIGSCRFRVSPLSFFQVNPRQTEVLYERVRSAAALGGRERVFDLYCGTGTIALYLAAEAAAVVGVEEVADAVRDAQANAGLNRCANARFIAGKAEVVAPQLAARGERPDVVVLDPPRKGCEEPLLRALLAMKPRRIVYVSCMPVTLARDLALLVAGGYAVTEVQPVDMFPHTFHIETVTTLVRR